MNQVIRIFDLWVDITGVDPTNKSLSFRDFDIYSANKEIEDALKLDDTGITALSIMDFFVEEYLNKRTFSVNEMICDFNEVESYLAKCKELYSLLRSEEISEFRENYKKTLLDTLKGIGVTNPKVYEAANDKHFMAFIRRDALKSMNDMAFYQFYQGTPHTKKLTYVKNVHLFFNINSLIKLINQTTEAGVSLNLIKDNEVNTSSYFAFAVKNGGNLTIITDKPDYTHPMQKHMSRRPGRDLSERVYKNHFPYELLNISFDYKGDAHVNENRNALVRYQENFAKMKEINDLNPDEVVWTVLMFTLIEKKLFKENFLLPNLTYTGDMVKSPVLADSIKNLPAVVGYKTLEMPEITSSDVSTDAMEKEWGHKASKEYQWIEDRYESKIDSGLLNIVSDEETPKVLIGAPDNETNRWKRADVIKYELKGYSPTEFGTYEEIVADRKWFARYNKVKQLQMHLDNEYNETKNEVIGWFVKKVKENAKNLLNCAAEGILEEERVDYGVFSDKPEYKKINMMGLFPAKDFYDDYYTGRSVVKLLGEGNCDSCRCYFDSEKPATILIRFKPHGIDGLLKLTGCKDVSELPEVIQHWTTIHPYKGNSILQRCDPLDWAIKNPWEENIAFIVDIAISKKTYNTARENLGLAPNKFWDTKTKGE